MELTVYNNFPKKKNSTLQPSGGTVYNITLKNPCSTINPVFLIDGVNLQANYCKWNGRYYYIDNIVLRNNNVYELHCSVDVLASWRSNILSTPVYCTRCSDADAGYVHWNPTIADSRYPSEYAQKTVQTPVNNFPGTTISGVYIVSVNGFLFGGSTAADYVMFTPAEYKKFLKGAFENFGYTETYSNSTSITEFILSAIYIPMVSGGAITPHGVGGQFSVCEYNCYFIERVQWACSGYIVNSGAYYEINAGDYTMQNHPQVSRGTWLNTMLSNHVFHWTPVGDVQLPMEPLHEGVDENKVLTYRFKLYVDLITGAGTMYVDRNKSTEFVRVLSLSLGSVGIPVRISGSSVTLSQGSGSAGASIIHGAVAGLFDALGSGNILSAFDESKMLPTFTSSGSSGGLSAYVEAPKILSTYNILGTEDLANQGRPCCRTLYLNTLPSGTYVETNGFEQLNSPCTPDEFSKINDFMKDGIYVY